MFLNSRMPANPEGIFFCAPFDMNALIETQTAVVDQVLKRDALAQMLFDYYLVYWPDGRQLTLQPTIRADCELLLCTLNNALLYYNNISAMFSDLEALCPQKKEVPNG